MNTALLLLLGLGLYFIVLYVVEEKKKESKIASETKPVVNQQANYVNLLDYQFDTENFPSTTYSQMFYSSTPWLHGRGIGDGKIYIQRDANIQEPPLELSQNELSQVLSQFSTTPPSSTTTTTQSTTIPQAANTTQLASVNTQTTSSPTQIPIQTPRTFSTTAPPGSV